MITLSTSKSGRTAYHHGDLREALIAAALEILGEGVDLAALSLREAARRAGVSAMAPYRHFEDKDALLAAVATRGFERLAAAQADAARSEDARVALVGQGVAYVSFACAKPALFRLMFGDVAVAKRGEVGEMASRSLRSLKDAVARVVPPERVEATALQCWAMAHGLAALAINDQLDLDGSTPSALAERVLAAWLDPRSERDGGSVPGEEAAAV